MKEPPADQDLEGLRLSAEPGGQVRDGSDGSIVLSAFKADHTQRGIAGRDAYPQAKVIAELDPLRMELGNDQFPHGQRHSHRLLPSVRDGNRVIEEDHHAVPGEALQGGLVPHDQSPHFGVILCQHSHDFFGFRCLGEGSESSEVEEHDRDLPPMALEQILVAPRENRLHERG